MKAQDLLLLAGVGIGGYLLWQKFFSGAGSTETPSFPSSQEITSRLNTPNYDVQQIPIGQTASDRYLEQIQQQSPFITPQNAGVLLTKPNPTPQITILPSGGFLSSNTTQTQAGVQQYISSISGGGTKTTSNPPVTTSTPITAQSVVSAPKTITQANVLPTAGSTKIVLPSGGTLQGFNWSK